MARIIVTGGAGMIGSNLVGALVRANHEVVILDDFSRGTHSNLKYILHERRQHVQCVKADLAAPGTWEQFLREADAVYHLADLVAGVGYVFENEGAIFRRNLQINANVASAVVSARPSRYIYVGTACSFPREIQTGVDALPMREEQQFPANPESGYGWSKLMGELDAKYIALQEEIETVVLVLHNVYGPPCEYRGNRAQAIPALVYRALCSKDQQLIVWGSGRQGRAFVHVDDVVRALLLSLKQGSNCGPIQIGPAHCTSIAEVAHMIIDLLGGKLTLAFDSTKPEGDLGRCADFSKAEALLGWRPTVDLRTGLASVIEYIKADLCLRRPDAIGDTFAA